MDPNSYYSFSSSSSSSAFMTYIEKEESTSNKEAPSFYSTPHAVRKPIMKKPIAPLPPMKPKVYKVEPQDFKEVVQRLTAEPRFQRRRLEEKAPPALDLFSSGLAGNAVAAAQRAKEMICAPNTKGKAQSSESSIEVHAPLERKTHWPSETCGGLSPLGFIFSPSSWNLSPLLSPGTLSALEQI